MGKRNGIKTPRVVVGPLTKLHRNPANLRQHPVRSLDGIGASLKHWSQVVPLLVQKSSGMVIDGNGRHEAMERAGWTKCQWIEIDVDDARAQMISVALNRTPELGTWDAAALGDFLLTLDHANFDMDALGYSRDDLGQLMASLDGDRPGTTNDPAQHWMDMPEFNQGDETPFATIAVHFRSAEDRESFCELLGQNPGRLNWMWHPKMERLKQST